MLRVLGRTAVFFGPRRKWTFRASLSSVGTSSGVGGTVSQEEVEKFGREADDWWALDGPALPLHAMNDLRVPLIRNALLGYNLDHTGKLPSPDVFPLAGRSILDVGCGVGILCEPLARLGAEVTGLEPAEQSIKVAKEHASHDPLLTDRLDYKCMSVEEYIRSPDEKKELDLVVASEVIEHVSNPPLFVENVTKLVKPGGMCLFTTLNRTQLSYLVAIVMAEYVLNWITRGTHDWHMFVSPQELVDMLCDNGMSTSFVRGMAFNPVTKRFSWTDNTYVNYALLATKPSL